MLMFLIALINGSEGLLVRYDPVRGVFDGQALSNNWHVYTQPGTVVSANKLIYEAVFVTPNII